MELQCRYLDDYNAVKRINANVYDSNVFCTERWDTFIRTTFNAKRHFIGIYDGSVLIGLWPSYALKKGPFKILGSPLRGWFTPWLGPRFFNEISENDIKALSQSALYAFDEYVEKNRFDYVECSSLNFEDETMRNLNYQPLIKATTIIDISLPSDDLLKSFGKTCRKKIKKAEKFGCTVEDISSTDFISQLWDMTVDVFGRRGSGPVHGQSLINNMIKAHLPTGHFICLGVFKDDRLIAIGTYVWHRKYLVGLFRATYLDCYKYYPYNILYWNLTKIAKEKGIEYYDMMGVDPKMPDQFKMSFHPQLIKWNHWAKPRTFLARTGRFFYEFYINQIVRNMARLGLKKN